MVPTTRGCARLKSLQIASLLSALLCSPLLISGCQSGGSASAYTIVTVAGNATDGSGGDGGLALNAQFNSIFGLTVDAAGNYYIADAASEVIRKVDVSTGVITTVAGNRTYGYSGDNGPATGASFNFPFGIAIDPAGNLYIADRGNRVIRKVSAATGIITTIAGSGQQGSGGDGGPAILASFYIPENLALDTAGNLYITDLGSGSIRKITAATGIISTVAGSGSSAADGVAATSASLTPDCIFVDSASNLYICDRNKEGVRKVTASTGLIVTLAGNGTYGDSGDGGPATNAEMATPSGIALSPGGSLIVGNYGEGGVRAIATNGIISTVAGYPQFDSPAALAFDSRGNLFVADVSLRQVRQITGVK